MLKKEISILLKIKNSITTFLIRNLQSAIFFISDFQIFRCWFSESLSIVELQD